MIFRTKPKLAIRIIRFDAFKMRGINENKIGTGAINGKKRYIPKEMLSNAVDSFEGNSTNS